MMMIIKFRLEFIEDETISYFTDILFVKIALV